MNPKSARLQGCYIKDVTSVEATKENEDEKDLNDKNTNAINRPSL